MGGSPGLPNSIAQHVDSSRGYSIQQMATKNSAAWLRALPAKLRSGNPRAAATVLFHARRQSAADCRTPLAAPVFPSNSAAHAPAPRCKSALPLPVAPAATGQTEIEGSGMDEGTKELALF
jgi:hypothetical protein